MNDAALMQFESPAVTPRGNRKSTVSHPVHLTRYDAAEDAAQRSAEVFYLQKQVQSQTPMVIVLEDGEQIDGVIEWYDRHCLKIRGRDRVLVYKSAIKYMYKHGEMGL
jgi:sRNA-binding regulator protein Hfq